MAPYVYSSTMSVSDFPGGSLWDMLRAGATEERLGRQDNVFIDVSSGERVTLRDALELSEALAKSFYHEKLLAPAREAAVPSDVQTLTIFSPSSIRYPVIFWAAMAAGVPLALIRHSVTMLEARYHLEVCRPALLVVHPSLAALAVEAGFPKERMIVTHRSNEVSPALRTIDDLIEAAHTLDDFTRAGKHPIAASKICTIAFSSGTTGKPKGIMHSHDNWKAFVHARQILDPAGEDAAGTSLRSVKHNTFLSWVPMSYVAGFLRPIVFPLIENLRVCIMPEYDHASILSTLSKYKVTEAFFNPGFALRALANPASVKSHDFSCLTNVDIAGGPLPPQQRLTFAELLAGQGAFGGQGEPLTVSCRLGMSEVPDLFLSPAAGPLNGALKLGNSGVLGPRMSARIVDPDWAEEEGVDVAVGQPGELLAKGVAVFMGYFNAEEHNRVAFTPKGWYKTGDEVRIDSDNQVFYVGRLKETFKRNTFQISPKEIADLIALSHPDIVSDVAVIGMPVQPSPGQTGEDPWAFVIPTQAAVERLGKGLLTEERIADELKATVLASLDERKRLKEVRLWKDTDFPRAGFGKVATREIRRRALEEFNVTA